MRIKNKIIVFLIGLCFCGLLCSFSNSYNQESRKFARNEISLNCNYEIDNVEESNSLYVLEKFPSLLDSHYLFSKFENEEENCWTHWVLVPLFMLGIASLLFFYLFFKKDFWVLKASDKNLLAIGSYTFFLILRLIFEIFGYCSFCIGFFIVDIITLAAFIAIWCYMYFTKINNKETVVIEEEIKEDVIVSKEVVYQHCINKYGNSIAIKHRPNFTKPGRGMKEGLPLADTFSLPGNKGTCFAYFYDLNGKCRFIIKVDDEFASDLRKNHKNITLSKFPKSCDTWYSVPVDESWNIDSLFEMFDKVFNLYK